MRLQVSRCPKCTEKEWKNSSRKKGRLGQSRNDAQLWMCLVVKEKFDAVKNNIAQEPGISGPSVKFSCSIVSDSVTPRIAACRASLSITNSQKLLKLMFIESVMSSNHLLLCHPLLLPSIFPSIRVFSNESVLCIRWPKYCSFSVSISPCNEYSGLISFRIDWFALLAVQETLKSLLQHHRSKASILQF